MQEVLSPEGTACLEFRYAVPSGLITYFVLSPGSGLKGLYLGLKMFYPFGTILFTSFVLIPEKKNPRLENNFYALIEGDA